MVQQLFNFNFIIYKSWNLAYQSVKINYLYLYLTIKTINQVNIKG